MDIILASHGCLASGMKSAVEMILGKADYMRCYDLKTYKMPSAILDELRGTKHNIIITDLLGGSINNALMELMEDNILITGMNLGLVLELCFHRNDAKLEAALQSILQETKKCICDVNDKKECYMESEELW